MAAQMTPAESGMILEPVERVTDWAKMNEIRTKLGENVMKYEEYTTQIEGEEQ